MNFVFDVDGTITPSREKMDEKFQEYFLDFCHKNTVYLVTGSDYAKTEEQVGPEICFAAEGVFNCSGNMLTRRNVEMYRNDFELTDDERMALKNELYASGFSVRTGNHIEHRIGTVNFSVVGRNANKHERQQYVRWDNATGERVSICARMNEWFPRLECLVGGETSIDICLRGYNKGQVKNHIHGSIIFFGDRCNPGGNDYSLALLAEIVHNVQDWRETESLLRTRYERITGKQNRTNG
jgi:phosphomannomutase